MDYIAWLNFKETLKDIAGGFVTVFKWIISVVVMIIRFVIYIASSFGLAIMSVTFPFGIYFCYTVIHEMVKGIPFMKTSHFGFFLLFFIVPIVLAIVREISKP